MEWPCLPPTSAASSSGRRKSPARSPTPTACPCNMSPCAPAAASYRPSPITTASTPSKSRQVGRELCCPPRPARCSSPPRAATPTSPSASPTRASSAAHQPAPRPQLQPPLVRHQWRELPTALLYQSRGLAPLRRSPARHQRHDEPPNPHGYRPHQMLPLHVQLLNRDSRRKRQPIKPRLIRDAVNENSIPVRSQRERKGFQSVCPRVCKYPECGIQIRVHQSCQI